MVAMVRTDTAAMYTFGGSAAGVGAMMKWEGNKNTGKGSIKITEFVPNSFHKMDLNFMERGVAVTSYNIEPMGEGTKVTWGFDADMGANPVMRIMGIRLRRTPTTLAKTMKKD